jgi:hypothetical protein
MNSPVSSFHGAAALEIRLPDGTRTTVNIPAAARRLEIDASGKVRIE